MKTRKEKKIKPGQREIMKHYQVMRWDAISGIIEEDGLSARQRDEENPFKVCLMNKDRNMYLIFTDYFVSCLFCILTPARMPGAQEW